MAKNNPAPPETTVSRAMSRMMTLRGLWPSIVTALAWFVLTFIFIYPMLGREEMLVERIDGEQEATTDIRAPARIEVKDLDRIAREQARVEQQFPSVWVFQPEVRAQGLEKLRRAVEILQSRQPTTGSDVTQTGRELIQETGIALTNEEIEYLKKNVNVPQMFQYMAEVLDRTLSNYFILANASPFYAQRNMGQVAYMGLPPALARTRGDVEVLERPLGVRSYVREIELRKYYPSLQDRRTVEIGTKILETLLQPNLRRSEQLTEEKKQEALESLKDLPPRVYEEGDLIARQGQVLSETQSAAVAAIQDLRRQAYPYRVGAVFVLTVLCFLGGAVYMRRFRRDFQFTPSNITLLCLPPLLALFVGFMGRLLYPEQVAEQLNYFTVLFPSSMVGMITAILIGPYAGFSLVLGTVLLFGVATGQSLEFLVYALVGGFTAVLSLQSFRKRHDVLRAGIRVALANFVTICFLEMLRVPPHLDEVLLLLGVINGLMYAAATLPLMLIFEKAFGIVTDMGLLELTSPDNELLRMLEEKAPGSYQHSLSVTKLAEAAAEAIGANFLLVRAGAYFHDIGKTVKPTYFSENQITLEHKKAHSKISPYMSVLIIKNHVKEGQEIARRAGLPQKVIDFIPQHHGTSLIRYFYTEALRRYEESESMDPVREEDFRYPGPKPQSIETAIVMLADSVEAIATATFTGAQVNENDLRRMVDRAVSERFQDGQFDECDLTMRDLFLIKESFVKTLKSRYHHRIAYPKEPGKREAAREVKEPSRAPEAVPAVAASGR